MKPTPQQQRWNHDTDVEKQTAAPTTTSWWIGKSREEFNELVKSETTRMSATTVKGTRAQ